MKRKGIILSCAVAFAFGVSSACAGTITLKEVVVTPTRNITAVSQTPSSVYVVTAKELKERGFVYVKNALKYISGISVVSNGAFGGLTAVSVRGLPSYYTKIMIDGVDVSDPSNPQPYFNLANLTVNDIERIEIVEGAQSGLYGANAIGGVINIITKKGKGKPVFRYSQLAGSYRTFGESASSSGSYDRISFYLNIHRFDTNGISKMDKYNPDDNSYSRGDEKDSYHKTDFYSDIEYSFSENFKLGALVKLYKTQNYLDNGWYVTSDYRYLPDDASESNNTPQAKSLRVHEHFALSKIYASANYAGMTLKFDAYYYQHFRYYKSAPPYWLDYKGKRWGSSFVGSYKKGGFVFTGGVEQKMDKYEDSSGFRKLRYNYAAFLEAQHSFGGFTLQAVGREDKYKTFGRHFTYKLGLSYSLKGAGTTFKANYSTGFRAPSIWELYAPANPSWYFLGGNRDLKPEKAKSWDFGVEQGFYNRRIVAGVTYFKSIVKDRIAYSTDPTTWKSTYENIRGKTVAHGVEVNLRVKPFRAVEAGVNYTYTRSRNPDTGKQSARIPYRTVTGYVTFKGLNNRLSATIDGRYIGKRYDDKNNTIQTGKYAVFDFTAVYRLNKSLEASLIVKNIFDRFYQEVYGYSTPGRSAFFRLTLTF